MQSFHIVGNTLSFLITFSNYAKIFSIQQFFLKVFSQAPPPPDQWRNYAKITAGFTTFKFVCQTISQSNSLQADKQSVATYNVNKLTGKDSN
jgi:hypothetical protein